MAINPPSDLLADVAAAAQPAKLREATQRLAASGAEAAAAANFAAAMNTVSGAKPTQATTATATSAALPTNTTKAVQAPLKLQTEKEALQKFEAFFLQTFVDSVLPKDADTVFGEGTAGDVWRSMLAEHIAAEIAQSSKFGIAERIAGAHFNAAPQQSLSKPVTEPGDKNLPYVKEPGKPNTPSGLATAAADVIGKTGG